MKSLAVGGELDSYCGRCKMLLRHIIVASVFRRQLGDNGECNVGEERLCFFSGKGARGTHIVRFKGFVND